MWKLELILITLLISSAPAAALGVPRQSCERPCAQGTECVKGKCVAVSECPSGFGQCGADGCVNLLNDVRHCGECDNDCCPGSNCINGECELNDGCPAGQLLCDTGCTNTSNDNRHCGACGIKCGQGKNCRNGKCR
ncbi:hypothetical protein CC85DRAFT_293136 [Cutaneotrichosporon oleaginosum]|uniref:Uncharacterized protein n=1 Tax=Cutaneotrichosporon oleaginosum TaxID=879819 RepID=A0A0J0XHN5_9TREE|nr:uncharacterized protein CC85DRAFT_293136 [Cutaneotrichosporon oleaginosum]KLT40578.1 hypothetical protein CC85DRAFT_293136 [Cutaneotrichosporon oleaginosum]TXT03904.1 hypothetical protein COLE_07601 [Cutaneotrichosporon oleaginosum]